jgi:hypothetical protein
MGHGQSHVTYIQLPLNMLLFTTVLDRRRPLSPAFALRRSLSFKSGSTRTVGTDMLVLHDDLAPHRIDCRPRYHTRNGRRAGELSRI